MIVWIAVEKEGKILGVSATEEMARDLVTKHYKRLGELMVFGVTVSIIPFVVAGTED